MRKNAKKCPNWGLKRNLNDITEKSIRFRLHQGMAHNMPSIIKKILVQSNIQSYCACIYGIISSTATLGFFKGTYIHFNYLNVVLAKVRFY